MIRNKKGFTGDFVKGLLWIIIFVGIIAVFINPGLIGLGGDFVTMTGGITDDTDGDGKTNFEDDCPCGSPPNKLNEMKKIDGSDYCFGKEDSETCQSLIDEGFDYKLIDINDGQGAVELGCFYKKDKKTYQCPELKKD